MSELSKPEGAPGDWRLSETAPGPVPLPQARRSGPLRRWTARLLALGIGLLFALGAAEIFFRVQLPIEEKTWPARFEPGLGFIFEPHAELRWTNHLDYATVTPTNSLGFLDREPALVDDGDVFRIAFLGDSFVEAAQVEIDQKVHVQLEERLAERFPERRFRTFAVGYSGSGTANMLPFYDRFVREMNPQLVALVFVNNDFANNSPLLESLRNGWQPYHSPRFFVEADGDTVRDVPIDPDWSQHVLEVEPVPTVDPPWYDGWLAWSSLYRFIRAKIGSLVPPEEYKLFYQRRIDALGALDPQWAEAFAGFDPMTEDMDRMFFREDLPPVFADALVSTEAALRRLKDKVEGDGARLVVLIHEGCTFPPEAKMEEGYRPGLYRERLEAILDRLGIVSLDMREQFAARGLERAHFKHDGHWSPDGHRVAAESLADFLAEHPDLMEPRR